MIFHQSYSSPSHLFHHIYSHQVSDQAMKTVALLMTRTSTKTRSKITFHSDKHSVVSVDPRIPDRPSFDITAVVDPVSTGAQKIAPLLLVLQEVVNAKIRVFLNCVDKHSEMPQKSYYRSVHGQRGWKGGQTRRPKS